MSVEVYVVKYHNATSGKGSYGLAGAFWTKVEAEKFVADPDRQAAARGWKVYSIHRFVEVDEEAHDGHRIELSEEQLVEAIHKLQPAIWGIVERELLRHSIIASHQAQRQEIDMLCGYKGKLHREKADLQEQAKRLREEIVTLKRINTTESNKAEAQP